MVEKVELIFMEEVMTNGGRTQFRIGNQYRGKIHLTKKQNFPFSTVFFKLFSRFCQQPL